MEERDSQLNSKLVLGIVVIVVGVVFTLRNLGFRAWFPLSRIWPVALIAVGIAKLFDKRAGSKFWAWALVVGGSVLLAEQYGFIYFSIWSLWPLLIVAVGGRIVWQAVQGERMALPMGVDETGSYLNESALFGGGPRRIVTPAFKGGHVTAVLGGLEIDLRDSSIGGDKAVVDVFVLWGGVAMIVPEGWNVAVKVLPIFGGAGDETSHPLPTADSPAPQLVITGYAVFGGFEVRNHGKKG